MLKIKRLVLTLIASLGLIAPLGIAGIAHAQVDLQRSICAGAGINADVDGCDQGAIDSAEGTATNLITRIINIFSLIVGIIAVIMIIIGGVKYITSGGDPGNVSGAKNTILYAVVGLIVVALAQIIVRFVLGSVGEATA